VGKEVRFHRVTEGVTAEEMEEAGGGHSFQMATEAEKWDNGNQRLLQGCDFTQMRRWILERKIVFFCYISREEDQKKTY
jgi:hypothetical protein